MTPSPGFAELWEGLTHARMDIAELKGMITMHFRDGVHHMPPCAAAANLQKTLHAVVGAAIISILSALGSILFEVLKQ